PDGVGDALSVQFNNDALSVQYEHLISGLTAPVISTRTVAAGSDPATAASTGNSGNLTLKAPSITLGEGTEVRAQADHGFPAGDVTLTATQALSEDDIVLQPFKTHSLTSAILLAGATVRAGNVQMIADGSTATFLGYDVFGAGFESYVAGRSLGALTNP